MKQLLIIGASGHGKVVAEIARRNGFQNIAFLDDNTQIKACGGFPVIGTSSSFREHLSACFFVAIGNPAVRTRLMEMLLKAGCTVVTLIHPSAVVSDDCSIGTGTVIMPGAVINAGTTIGKGCIINTGATVDHDNQIADYVHISVGAHLAGSVTVGSSAWVGAGAIISNNLSVCCGAILGAGAVVIRKIELPGTYVGIPAKLIKTAEASV